MICSADTYNGGQFKIRYLDHFIFKTYEFHREKFTALYIMKNLYTQTFKLLNNATFKILAMYHYFRREANSRVMRLNRLVMICLHSKCILTCAQLEKTCPFPPYVTSSWGN